MAVRHGHSVDARAAVERDRMSAHIGRKTVPDRMIGCWRRRHIRFETGAEDVSTRVIWVQTASGMADMRIAANRPDLRGREGLARCSTDELVALAEQDCSCGTTELDEGTAPYPTAVWQNGSFGFALQPVSRYPEPGWFEWRQQETCMLERAPSGAYEEDWRLEARSRGNALHITHRGATAMENLFIAGEHCIYARDRTVPVEEKRPLRDLVMDRLHDREYVHALLDFEMSYAQRRVDQIYRITLSSLPWKEGREMDLSWTSNLKHTAVLKDADGRIWNWVSAWRD